MIRISNKLTYENNTLTHHGILGMKWGVRRFQNKDGSLTQRGSKRYNPETDAAKQNIQKNKALVKKATKNYNKQTLGGMVVNLDAQKRLAKSKAELKYSKEDLKKIKLKQSLDKQKNKSNRQIEMEKKYEKDGMTKEEAQLAAYKRVKTERIIAVTAGMTVAAATAYVAYKHHDNTVDKILKSGTELQNISTNSNRGVKDAFYTSNTKMDNIKYKGMYGDTLSKTGDAVYKTNIGIHKDLKVASRKSATNVLSDMLNKDLTYRSEVINHLGDLQSKVGTPQQKKLISDAHKSLQKGVINSKVYEAVNLGLVDHSTTGNNVSKRFYDELKTKGYSAIKDVNDSKYSGYMSKNPLIVFDGGDKVSVKNVSKLTAEEIRKSKSIGYADIIGKQTVKDGAKYAAIAAGVGVVNSVSTKVRNNGIVSAYRTAHPNSDLSYTDIVRNYERSLLE